MEKGFLYIGKHETLNLFTGLFREITPWKFWNVYQAKRLSEQSVKGKTILCILCIPCFCRIKKSVQGQKRFICSIDADFCEFSTDAEDFA